MLKALIIKPLWGGGSDYVEPHVVLVEETNSVSYKAITPPPPPPPAMAGDIAYWDGSAVKTCTVDAWSTSLGTPVGVVVIPEGFAPDGKARIVSLKGVDKNGNQTDSNVIMKWGPYGTDTSLPNYTSVPTTDNAGSTSTGSDSTGYLPSDILTAAQSYVDPEAKYVGSTPYIPSPYLGDAPNPEYYKELDGGNALSDFNGLSNTQTLVGLGSDYEAANACWKYKDGVSNLQWYLPAAGELGYLISRYKKIDETIRNVLNKTGYMVINWWTSTEYSASQAYNKTAIGMGISPVSKTYYSSHIVTPFATIV